MATAFWVRRAATVFWMIAALLVAVSPLKGQALPGSLAFAAGWASVSTAVFIGARLYQSSRGHRCELCQDVPDPLTDPGELSAIPHRGRAA